MKNICKEFKKWIINAKRNELYILVGLTLIAIGIALWCDQNYFFFPPKYIGLMNDDGFDALGVAIGGSIIAYGILNTKNNLVAGLLLGLATFFVASITIIELIHVLIVGQFRMIITIIGNIFLIAVIMHISKERNSK